MSLLGLFFGLLALGWLGFCRMYKQIPMDEITLIPSPTVSSNLYY